MYQEIWTATEGETRICSRETRSREDPFAVAVVKSGEVVGHVPRSLSCVCSLFLRRGGSMACRITGKRQHSSDLPQGGLEIPCIYVFSGPNDSVEKAKQRLAELKINTYAGSKINASEMDAKLHAGSQSNVDAKIQTGSDTHSDGDVDGTLPIARDMLPADAIKTGSAVWIAVKDITLTEDDKRVIIDCKMLQDQHINFAQRLINQQFPNINGLQLSVMQDKPFKGSTRNALQIIHVRENHWIVAASHKAKVIHVYNSAFSSLDQTSAATVQNLFRCNLSNISMVPTQKQLGGSDCGLFAIANATAIAFGRDPSKEVYQQSLMRNHVITCFEQQKMELLP